MHGSIASSVEHALRSPRSMTPLVLIMGFIGAVLRYALEMVLPADGGFPVATLSVNIFGCFTLEIINQFVARRTNLPAPLVKSMGVGLIGAFTTIAALSTENLTFLQNGRYEMFALYLGVTVTSTFCAALVGKAVADKLARTRSAKEIRTPDYDTRETTGAADSERGNDKRKNDAGGQGNKWEKVASSSLKCHNKGQRSQQQRRGQCSEITNKDCKTAGDIR